MDKNENIMENMTEKCSIKCTINQLNDDCLRIIFRYLPIVDRIRIERVSKRWQSVSKDSWHKFKDLSLIPCVWGLKGLWVGYRRNVCVTNEILEAVLTRCGQFIKTINFSMLSVKYQIWNKFNQETLEVVSRLCTNLEFLKTDLLQDSRGLRIIKPLCKNFKQFCFLAKNVNSLEDDFLNLFKLMKKLNRLWLAKCHFSGECLSYLPMDTVQEICLQSCNLISASSFCNAIQRLEMLQTLVLDDCHDVNDSLLKILTSKAQTLKALALCSSRGSEISENGFKFISKLVCLEKLQLNGYTKVTNEVIKVIANSCRQLYFLDVCCTSITDEGIFYISFLPKLRHLKLANLSVTGQYLSRIHALEYLDCKYSHLLENDNVCALIVKLPRLKILVLDGCKLITNKVIRTALKVNTQRKRLIISTRMTLIFALNEESYYPSVNLYTVTTFNEVYYDGFSFYSESSSLEYDSLCFKYFTHHYKAIEYPSYEIDDHAYSAY